MYGTSNKLLLLLALLVCLVGRGFGLIIITGAEKSSGSTWDRHRDGDDLLPVVFAVVR